MPAPSAKVAWILWGAMLVAVLDYVLIATITEVPAAPSLIDDLPFMIAVFAGIAVVNAALSLYLAPVLGRLLHSFWVYFVARLLFAESIAVIGLMLRFLGAAPAVFFGFVGASAALLLLAIPTGASRAAALRRL